MADISIEVNEINVVSVKNMADISIEVNEINVVSVKNMADISIEVNEINVVSVKRSSKGYLSLSVKAQVEGRAETVKNSKCTVEDRQNWSLWHRILIQSLWITIFFEWKLRITPNFELDYM